MGVTINVKDSAQLILKGCIVQIRRTGHVDGPRPELCARSVEVDDLGDRGQLFVERGDAEVNACLGGLSLEQGTEHQGQDAVEGMDPQFLIGPMKGRREADPMRVFHLFECILDAGLGPAAENDLLRGPVVVVGTEDAFAEAGAFEVFQRQEGSIQEGKVQRSVCAKNFGFKDLGGVLARDNGIEPFFEGTLWCSLCPWPWAVGSEEAFDGALEERPVFSVRRP